jgi:hypothetical protein
MRSPHVAMCVRFVLVTLLCTFHDVVSGFGMTVQCGDTTLFEWGMGGGGGQGAMSTGFGGRYVGLAVCPPLNLSPPSPPHHHTPPQLSRTFSTS